MPPTRYRGYRSFSYLEPGTDFPEFEPSADVGRLPPHDLGLTAAESARAERLLAENVVVSLHDHPVRLPGAPGPNCSSGTGERGWTTATRA
ncbi:hypothetical protein [Amycolatopsis sp. WGS_07]|uniref:hypothetical protein n=1 Tax=Amycolatopsis sp. WGS_07 TaxID=3076764 RepID=UPI003872C1F0